eukprot:gene2052-110_t
MMVAADDRSTVVTGRPLRASSRVLRNKTAEEVMRQKTAHRRRSGERPGTPALRALPLARTIAGASSFARIEREKGASL